MNNAANTGRFDADERLIRETFGTTPKPGCDLWPRIRNGVTAQEAPRRQLSGKLILAVSLAAAALCLMGAGKLFHWTVYTPEGTRVELTQGEAYSPKNGDAAIGDAAIEVLPGDPPADLYDDRDHWQADWNKQSTGDTKIAAWQNGGSYGQYYAAEERTSESASSGSWGALELNSTSLDEIGKAARNTNEPVLLPESVPERYRFAHGSLSPYLTPQDTKNLTLLKESDTGDFAARLYQLPENYVRQTDDISLFWYAENGDRFLFSAYLADSNEMTITGSEKLKVKALRLKGYEKGLYYTDYNAALKQSEIYIRLWQRIVPVTVCNDPLAGQSCEADSLLQRLLTPGPKTETEHYRFYTLSVTGMTEEEINTLLASLR